MRIWGGAEEIKVIEFTFWRTFIGVVFGIIIWFFSGDVLASPDIPEKRFLKAWGIWFVVCQFVFILLFNSMR
jgi:hypothetical protein